MTITPPRRVSLDQIAKIADATFVAFGSLQTEEFQKYLSQDDKRKIDQMLKISSQVKPEELSPTNQRLFENFMSDCLRIVKKVVRSIKDDTTIIRNQNLILHLVHFNQFIGAAEGILGVEESPERYSRK